MHNEYVNIPSPRGGHIGDIAHDTRDIWTNTRRPVILNFLYINFMGNYAMATCERNKCGMAVNTSFTKCDVALVDNSLELGNGN